MAHVRESVVQEKALKVTDGVIVGAKLLGNESVNGRRYGDDVIAEGIDRYNGAKVYLNHPERSAGPGDRDFNDWVGVVESAAARRGHGGFGDVRLRQEHPRFKEICEAVEKFPKHFGLSHVADIDSEKRGAVEHVTKIGEVFSVDIVTDPATTKGIFESRDNSMKKLTAKQVLESTKGSKSPLRKIVAEMVEAGAMPETAEVSVADTAGAGDEANIKALVMAEISKALETATVDVMKKVLKTLGIGDSLSEVVAGGAEAQPGTPEPPAETPAAKEARELRHKMAKLESENLLRKHNREATEIQIEAVAAVQESKRESLVKSFPAVTESNSHNRPPRPKASPGASDEDGDDDVAEYAKTFESRAEEARKAVAESRKR